MSEVRHLWNRLIAELNSRNGSSSLAKSGTFDDFCIAFHPRVRWQTGGLVRARNMAEIYYLPRKTFTDTDRTDGRLHQDTEKIPLSPNSAYGRHSCLFQDESRPCIRSVPIAH